MAEILLGFFLALFSFLAGCIFMVYVRAGIVNSREDDDG